MKQRPRVKIAKREPAKREPATKKQPSKHRTGRSGLVLLAMALLLLGIVTRAFVLQFNRAEPLKKMAEEQYLKEIEIPARRGAIFDRAGNALAVSNEVQSVFAHPHRVQNVANEAGKVAKLLGLKVDEVAKKLASDRLFVWLKRRIDPKVATEIRGLNLPSLGAITEWRRYYPNRSLFSHLLGGVDVDDRGIEGLESFYEQELAGMPSSASGLKDARGRVLLIEGVADSTGLNGSDIYLTVDRDIQSIAATALADGITAVHAKAGSAIVLDPRTGDVLALANYPEYNPNNFDKIKEPARRNRAVADLFEPGSTFKTIMMAAALEEGITKINDQVFCENGIYKLGGETIHDTHPHGLISAKTIISSSSNIGAAKIGVQLGRERFASYIQSFGFGSKTGIELPGEALGIVRPAKKWPLIQLATVSFGQGISVSALQLAQAYATIANGGILHEPHLVRMIQTPDGSKRVMPRSAGRRVISAETARTLTSMLQAVVSSEGTGFRAEVEGVATAGKTATAQKPSPFGGYSSDKFVANFAGYLPANDPRLVVIVIVDEPQRGMHFGGVAAAPIFQKIAKGALQVLGLLPTGVIAEVPAIRPETLAEVSEEANEEDGVAGSGGPVPDLRGLTLRDALEVLKKRSLNVETDIQGSGKVIAQDPAAGSHNPTFNKLRLILTSAEKPAGEKHAAR